MRSALVLLHEGLLPVPSTHASTERQFEEHIRDLVIKTARNPAEASLFNHASSAFNNDFYFRGLTLNSDTAIPNILERVIINDFGSVENLRAEMCAMAAAMFGPGYVWLMRMKSDRTQKSKFMLLPTYLAGSPLVGAHNRRQPIDMNTQNVANVQEAGGVKALSQAQYPEHLEPQNSVGAFGRLSPPREANAPAFGGVNATPCLCVSTWEHSYMIDYTFSKKQYLQRWWSFIDWNRVLHLANIGSEAQSHYQTVKGTRA
jgi:superoxide dismutase, Fe-Mn family